MNKLKREYFVLFFFFGLYDNEFVPVAHTL